MEVKDKKTIAEDDERGVNKSGEDGGGGNNGGSGGNKSGGGNRDSSGGNEGGGGGDNSGGGGIINDLISNLFCQNEGKGNDDNENQTEKRVDSVKTKEEDGGGEGGIIDNFLNEVDLTADEASILIHSIVHD